MSTIRPRLRSSLLLDFDGTIADSITLLRKIYFDIVADLGGLTSDGDFESLIGLTLKDICKRILQRYGTGGDVDALQQLYLNRIALEYNTVKPFPDAIRLIQLAIKHEYAIAIVTSSTTKLVLPWIKAQHLSEHISAVITAEDYRHGKPDPEPFLLAISATGSAPDLALAVDDAPDGVQAALASGSRTFALARRKEAALAWPAGATLVPDLDAVTSLLSHLARAKQ